MATPTTGKFSIDGLIKTEALLPGEARLYAAFAYPTLEDWRRRALTAAATVTDIATQSRAAIVFAYGADMSVVFRELTGVIVTQLKGHYDFKSRANEADKKLLVAYQALPDALRELKQQGMPDQYLELILRRVTSETFNHRVAGVCAAVYFTGLLLSDAEAAQ